MSLTFASLVRASQRNGASLYVRAESTPRSEGGLFERTASQANPIGGAITSRDAARVLFTELVEARGLLLTADEIEFYLDQINNLNEALTAIVEIEGVFAPVAGEPMTLTGTPPIAQADTHLFALLADAIAYSSNGGATWARYPLPAGLGSPSDISAFRDRPVILTTDAGTYRSSDLVAWTRLPVGGDTVIPVPDGDFEIDASNWSLLSGTQPVVSDATTPPQRPGSTRYLAPVGGAPFTVRQFVAIAPETQEDIAIGFQARATAWAYVPPGGSATLTLVNSRVHRPAVGATLRGSDDLSALLISGLDYPEGGEIDLRLVFSSSLVLDNDTGEWTGGYVSRLSATILADYEIYTGEIVADGSIGDFGQSPPVIGRLVNGDRSLLLESAGGRSIQIAFPDGWQGPTPLPGDDEGSRYAIKFSELFGFTFDADMAAYRFIAPGAPAFGALTFEWDASGISNGSGDGVPKGGLDLAWSGVVSGSWGVDFGTVLGLVEADFVSFFGFGDSSTVSIQPRGQRAPEYQTVDAGGLSVVLPAQLTLLPGIDGPLVFTDYEDGDGFFAGTTWSAAGAETVYVAMMPLNFSTAVEGAVSLVEHLHTQTATAEGWSQLSVQGEVGRAQDSAFFQNDVDALEIRLTSSGGAVFDEIGLGVSADFAALAALEFEIATDEARRRTYVLAGNNLYAATGNYIRRVERFNFGVDELPTLRLAAHGGAVFLLGETLGDNGAGLFNRATDQWTFLTAFGDAFARFVGRGEVLAITDAGYLMRSTSTSLRRLGQIAPDARVERDPLTGHYYALASGSLRSSADARVWADEPHPPAGPTDLVAAGAALIAWQRGGTVIATRQDGVWRQFSLGGSSLVSMRPAT